MEHFQGKICQMPDGRYQVGLLWRQDLFPNNNIGQALNRMFSLLRKLSKEPKILSQYNEILMAQLADGIIEDAPKDGSGGRYYMPHRAVVNEAKLTTKLRIVYDASAKTHAGLSLNECLEKGPNQNCDLIQILIRFRMHKVGLCSDIEKAFHQIVVQPEDRDVLRFLWVENPFDIQTVVREFRFCRVVFGITCSPFLLAATLRHHLRQQEQTEMVQKMLNSFYVDDFICGDIGDEEAFQMYIKSKNIMRNGGMNLRKWTSNSKDVMNRINEKESCLNTEFNRTSETSLFKVLGLKWDTDTDTFHIELENLLCRLRENCWTKRSLLGIACSVYDPLGFLIPFTIRIKIMFQGLWIRGYEWDEALPHDVMKVFKSWCTEIEQLEHIAINRWFQRVEPCNTEVHIFTDASEHAMCSSAYIRCFTNKEIHTHLLFAKSRLAPVKRISLPRLELIAAVLGSRIKKFICTALLNWEIRYFYWTDSQLVLNWLKSESRDWKPFVRNRIAEIQDNTSVDNWYYVKSSENPADLGTRGISVNNLKKNDLWWYGPKFLHEHDRVFNNVTAKYLVQAEGETERRSKINLLVNAIDDPVIDISRFSRLYNLMKTTKVIFTFIRRCRKSSEIVTESEDYEHAMRYWIQKVQDCSFQEEISAINAGRVLDSNSKLSALHPFTDEHGILRLGGRLQNLDIDNLAKHPIILPSSHRFVELLVWRYHEDTFHLGIRDVLNSIRMKYWIIGGRTLIKRLLKHCVVCRKLNAMSMNQIEGQLPVERIEKSNAFQNTGIDFCGPIHIKHHLNKVKVHVCLFTCATSRAVHLELTSDLTAESFLMALRRFISRRGVPRVIFSDNGQAFKKANKDLRKIYSTAISCVSGEYIIANGINWKFIVPKAPWWGGFWERMIRTVKQCLIKALGKAYLTYEQLNTVLIEIEAVLNSRPITTLSDDPNDITPLTPEHLLHGRKLSCLPITRHQDLSAYEVDNVRRYKYLRSLLHRFWSRWHREYVLGLRAFHTIRGSVQNCIKKGKIVLVEESNVPRQRWPMGRVLHLFPGKDGQVRACDVLLGNRNIIKRPIQALIPLECDEQSVHGV